MVDRISKREHEMGRYLRPAPAKSDEAALSAEAKTDMVTALLETEKNRKRERELVTQQEEAAANRRKELRAMTVDELKGALSSRGAEPTGKKEEMVEALFELYVQEDVVAARKAELQSLSAQELKELLTSKGLETGSKGEMVETVLSYEAKLQEELQAWNAKAAEVIAQRKEEFDAKTNVELKELCASKGLKLGNAREERVERLVEDLQQSGEIDAAVTRAARKTRREALNTLGKEDLVELCAKLGIDPLVKEVLVERILSYEAECGPLVAEAAAPAAKKARSSKK
mmetsp:Transcript_107816/g.337611  ORF Transcript_107816/g.337611 Transcript_107816/m.337611 type:complete len:286 (-) Transcript_107816:202-1059(-)